ncbi:MAG: hypothetical protein R3305_04685 [Gammaproteobacteria bacterium]|nr:hypothetical protein [Gammaproteobacteria bacterium]
MRNLFLALVLANLGFIAWALWFAPPQPVATRYDGPSITLMREIDADIPIVPAAVTAPAQPEPSDAVASCIAIGPFNDPAETSTAIATLVAAGFAPAETVATDEVWDGYWVYVERIESMAAANQMLATLSDNGIDDAYVIPQSDSGILISLGVFSEISRAGARGERVSELGFDVTIAERVRSAESTWLEVPLTAGQTVDLEILQPAGRISRLEQRSCQPAP